MPQGFGQRFSGLAPDVLNSLEALFAEFSGSSALRGPVNRAGDLRRLRRSGDLDETQLALVNDALSSLGGGRGFSSFAQPEGGFNLGKRLNAGITDQERRRLFSILNQRSGRLDDSFRGGRVGIGDLRRFLDTLQNDQASGFIQDLITRLGR